MKRKIGFGLLLVLNATFIYVIIMNAILGFGLIVQIRGDDDIVRQVSMDIIIRVICITIVILFFNYLLYRNMISNKLPLILSVITSLVGIVIFVPFFISAKNSFVDYRNGKIKLIHYLDKNTITETSIITIKDTIVVKNIDEFIIDIGSAKYTKGPWKYIRTFKILIKRNNGSQDIIMTNGQLFGAFKGKYFTTDHNVIEKYLTKE